MQRFIIRKIEQAPADYQYKAALEKLQEINRYTRSFHHAPVEGSVTEDTSVEELRRIAAVSLNHPGYSGDSFVLSHVRQR